MEHRHEQGRSYEIVTDALTRKMGPPRYPRSPEQWTNYLCPVHEDDGQHHNPSLGVRYDAAQERTIVRCWARCDDEEVVARIGLRVRDMFDRLPERARNNTNTGRNNTRTSTTTSNGSARRSFGTGGRSARPQSAGQKSAGQVVSPVEKAILAAHFPILSKPDLGVQTGRPETVDSYIYRWPNGRVEGAVHRVRTPHEHGYAKSFWQAHWTGSEWERTGFAPIPWKLADIREALDTGREIYVCEGEKDVQRANQAGQIATCNAMGAGSWTPEHARWLAGAARVIVVADRDRPGYRHAAKVADSLAERVGEVRVVQARDGKDLSDHFDAGYDLADLEPVKYLDRPSQARFRSAPVNRGQSRQRSR
ncbi:toprim domain-containing protein [Nocardia sp. NBC_01377]|uniref:toprim domain-containing protein n=1 Tax=Nocardia sp. NBC_01377 TaxID=2903595 RepID=UPI00324A9423